MFRHGLRRFDIRWLMLGMALLAGALAAWAAQHHVRTLVARLEADARQPTRSVVVAAVDLAAGSRVGVDTVALREMPLEWLASDALLPEGFAAVEGAVLRRAVRRGEPLLLGYIETQRPSPFSAQLAEGRRAVTIPVDEISSMSGMLEPGDLIDLYVSFEHERRRIVAPLLQSVRVLATGRQFDEDGGAADAAGFATVTLDASPQDAVRLIAARQQGSISAMLRHAGDAHTTAVVGSGDLATLLGLAAEPVAPSPEVPVIFGDRGPRTIPRLGESASAPAHDAGFDLEDFASADDMPDVSGVTSTLAQTPTAARIAAHTQTRMPTSTSTPPPDPGADERGAPRRTASRHRALRRETPP